MPRKIENTTKAHLISVPLPQHGTSYTVISHQFIIDYAYQSLANAGFAVVSEEYRCTADGQIAQGVYKLNFNNDPELSMMFAWTNSYNKQVKFKCLVGAYINNTGGVMISGEVGTWVRKHMGAADTETKGIIDDYISNAHMYYNQLVADKNAMEHVVLNTRKQAQLLGVLFAEYGILTTEQASMVRDQMKKPSFTFENSDSLWAFYNYVTIALQQSHPKTWMEDQRILHYFISTIIKSAPVPVPVQIEEPVEEVVDPLYEVPNQTNILDQIDEINAFSMAQLAGVKAPESLDLNIEAEEKSFELTEEVVAETIAPMFEERVDEVVIYTDSVGNTFEAPIVEEKSFNDVLEEAMIAKANFIEVETPKSEFAEEDNFSLDEDLPSLAINEVLEDVVNLNVLPVAEVKEDDDFNFDLDFDESGDDDTPDFF
jgi:hypothetical protein